MSIFQHETATGAPWQPALADIAIAARFKQPGTASSARGWNCRPTPREPMRTIGRWSNPTNACSAMR
jgi:hypothetical protein